MDTEAVLAAFDDQIRRNPQPGPGSRVERDSRVVRVVSSCKGWSGVTWSDLAGDEVAAVVAEQAARFAALDQAWEWKHYSHDRPSDLPERLRAAGLTPDPAETLLVAQISELDPDVRCPDGVELVPVVDQGGVDALVGVHDDVFGGAHADVGRAVLHGLAQEPTAMGRWSPWPSTGRSRPAGWSSTTAPILPACGVGAPYLPGGGAGCSARWSLTGPLWPGIGGFGISRSMPLPTADRSSSVLDLFGWLPRPPKGG